MPYHNRKSTEEENKILYSMHGDGFIAQSKNMVTNMVDTVQRILPKGTGTSMGTATTVLAVGAGLAVSEILLLGLAGYCIGKTIDNWATSSAREAVNESFNSDSEEI